MQVTKTAWFTYIPEVITDSDGKYLYIGYWCIKLK